jgi:hypothetical protein
MSPPGRLMGTGADGAAPSTTAKARLCPQDGVSPGSLCRWARSAGGRRSVDAGGRSTHHRARPFWVDRDAQPAPTERRPPPQRKPDFFHSTGFLPVPFVDGDRAQLEGVAPSTPGDGPRTTAPDRFGIRDAQPAPTERRPPPQRNGDFVHRTGFLSVLRLAWTFLVLVGLPRVVPAETTWRSAVTGQELRLESFEPIPQAPAGTRVPLVLYLLHLAAPRNGTVAGCHADRRVAGPRGCGW